MQAHLKPSLIEATHTVNEDGEILNTEVKQFKYLASTRESFFITYTELLSVFYNKLSLAEVKLYAYLLETYVNESLIGMNVGVKKEVALKLNLSFRTIENTLYKLCENKLIYAIHKGAFKLNPRYAFKGSTHERNKVLKAVLELECPDC